MDALPAPAMLATSRLRLVPIRGDAMAPTLRAGDCVMALPGDGYANPSMYVVQMATGATEVVRAAHIGGQQIRMSRDNPAYGVATVPLADFNAMVVGHVVATGRMVDPALIEERA